MPPHTLQSHRASPMTVPMCATHWETLTKTSTGWICPQCESAATR
jgi:hypothetical protein